MSDLGSTLDAVLERMAQLPARVAAEAARQDQEERWGRGEMVSAERYLDALPRVAASPEDAMVLIYGEALLRGSRETLNLARYRERYPHLAGHLEALGEVHGAVFADGGFSTTGDVGPTPPMAGMPVVPGYELIRQVGQGGMGVVWQARQMALNRVVALKLIRAAELAGPEEVARFLTEAEALAAVEHPNVVRVYEMGRQGGRPYVALEFVAGGSLADRLRQGPLAAREAARLVEQVARGVQAVHDKGIVHRDLKPGNVLLASGVDAKVTDFGLARRVEAGSGLTQTGVVMGTPSYVAPEQARGDSKRVGPAADTYGLGAVLYECLTGRPPFVGPDVMDVLLQVVNDEPVHLRALSPKTPRDLETICHKCLHKDPARRYLSAQALADDLQRFQFGEPIVARPVGAVERAAKWARRRPAVAALLTLLVVGVAVAFYAVRREQLRTAAALVEAQANLEKARQAVDECFGLAKDHHALQAEPLSKVRQLLLQKTLPFYETFSRQSPTDATLVAQQADYLYRFSYITNDIGRPGDALPKLEQARDILSRLVAEHPENVDYQANLGQALCTLGKTHAAMGKTSEAQAEFERSLDVLTRATQARPDAALPRTYLAVALREFGDLLLTTRQPAEAIRHYEQSRDHFQEVLATQPQDHQKQTELARTHLRLGQAQLRSGQPALSVENFQKARDLWSELSKSYPEVLRYQSGVAAAQNRLGHLLGDMGKAPEGIAAYEQAREIWARLCNLHPDFLEYKAGLAYAHAGLGYLQMETAKPKESLGNVERARDLFQELRKAQPDVNEHAEGLARSRHLLGMLHWQTDNRKEAIRQYEQARDLRLALTKASPDVTTYQAGLAHTWNNLGACYHQHEQAGDAVKAYRESLAIWEKLSQSHPGVPDYQMDCARTANNLGYAQAGLGLHKEALANYRRAMEVTRQLVKAYPKVPGYQAALAGTHRNLGIFHSYANQHREAREQFENTRAILLDLTKAHPTVTDYQIELGGTYCNLAGHVSDGKVSAECLPYYDEAIRLLQAVLDREPGHASARGYLVKSHGQRAQALTDLGRHREAVPNWEAAEKLDEGRWRPLFRRQIALGLARCGEYARARQLAADPVLQEKLAPTARIDLASLYALLARGNMEDVSRPLAERVKQAEQWARQAMEMLRKEAEGGVFRSQREVNKVKTDPALDFLREREDFRQWLAGVTKEVGDGE